MAHSCPTCGRAYPKPKAVKTADLNAVDLTTLPDEGLYAHFKKTAPVEDVRFALRIGLTMSQGLREDWEALYIAAPVLNRTETYKRLKNLQERWRYERIEAERAERAADWLAKGIAKAPELYAALMESAS